MSKRSWALAGARLASSRQRAAVARGEGPNIQLSDRSIRTADQFSFGVAFNAKNQREIRLAHTRQDSTTGKFFIQALICDGDLNPNPAAPDEANCQVPPLWNTSGVPGDQYNPSVVVHGGDAPDAPATWVAMWLSRQEAPAGNTISVKQASLSFVGNDGVMIGFPLASPQIPCTRTDGYWGDFSDLTTLVGQPPRFAAPFTDNFDHCNFQGPFAGDMHVSAVVFP